MARCRSRCPRSLPPSGCAADDALDALRRGRTEREWLGPGRRAWEARPCRGRCPRRGGMGRGVDDAGEVGAVRRVSGCRRGCDQPRRRARGRGHGGRGISPRLARGTSTKLSAARCAQVEEPDAGHEPWAHPLRRRVQHRRVRSSYIHIHVGCVFTCSVREVRGDGPLLVEGERVHADPS